MSRNTRIFSDLDLNFTRHPITGDVSVRYDENAIKNAVKNLVLTQNYERPFHSELGSPLKGLLFELPSPMLNITIQRVITDLINNFEPRVNLMDVEVSDDTTDNNSINVTITFTILNTIRPITIDIVLERTR